MTEPPFADAQTSDPDRTRRRLTRRNVGVLVLAQALLGAQMPMIFTVGGLAGQSLAPDPCVSTLPLSMIVLGSALSAQPLSAFMARNGRRAGFVLAAIAGAFGAALAATALILGSYALFMAGSLFTGIYMSAQGFFRFAAADGASAEEAPRAISWVMGGGLAAAIVGPALVRATVGITDLPFLATYLAIIVLNLCGPILFAFLETPPAPSLAAAEAPSGRSRRALLRDPRVLVAMICAMVSYALMNLVMTSAPLAVVGCGYTAGDAAGIVSAHVLAMYLPSFFTGTLINRFGRATITGAGLVILALAGAVSMTGADLGHFFGTLILLGLGWNFGFIGATAMLGAAHRPEERGTVQGMNDFVVFSGVFLASLSSGSLMNCASAGNPIAGWHAVNLAMLPFLTLAGGALIWLAFRSPRTN